MAMTLENLIVQRFATGTTTTPTTASASAAAADVLSTAAAAKRDELLDEVTVSVAKTPQKTVTISSNSTATATTPDSSVDPRQLYDDSLTATTNSYDIGATAAAVAAGRGDHKLDNTTMAAERPLRIFVMRHGERVDFTFGQWVPYCWNERGEYVPGDLNMPSTLPARRNGPKAWDGDSPLTNVGVFQARLIGEALREQGVQMDAVYASPSFRCVQTCSSVLEGLRQKATLPMRIEPALFEWAVWHKHLLQLDWCTREELVADHFNVAADYVPVIEPAQINDRFEETYDEFYDRNAELAHRVAHTHKTGNVLLVGHAATLDTCSQGLCGSERRPLSELMTLMLKVPYCSIVMLEQEEQPEQVEGESESAVVAPSKWKIVTDGPRNTVTHSNNQRFDANVLKK